MTADLLRQLDSYGEQLEAGLEHVTVDDLLDAAEPASEPRPSWWHRVLTRPVIVIAGSAAGLLLVILVVGTVSDNVSQNFDSIAQELNGGRGSPQILPPRRRLRRHHPGTGGDDGRPDDDNDRGGVRPIPCRFGLWLRGQGKPFGYSDDVRPHHDLGARADRHHDDASRIDGPRGGDPTCGTGSRHRVHPGR